MNKATQVQSEENAEILFPNNFVSFNCKAGHVIHSSYFFFRKNISSMYLSTTRLVLPWSLGQTPSNSSTFTPYQWNPDPYVSTLVVIMMVTITLMPAICSMCYHVYIKTGKFREVMYFNLSLQNVFWKFSRHFRRF